MSSNNIIIGAKYEVGEYGRAGAVDKGYVSTGPVGVASSFATFGDTVLLRFKARHSNAEVLEEFWVHERLLTKTNAPVTVAKLKPQCIEDIELGSNYEVVGALVNEHGDFGNRDIVGVADAIDRANDTVRLVFRHSDSELPSFAWARLDVLKATSKRMTQRELVKAPLTISKEALLKLTPSARHFVEALASAIENVAALTPVAIFVKDSKGIQRPLSVTSSQAGDVHIAIADVFYVD